MKSVIRSRDAAYIALVLTTVAVLTSPSQAQTFKSLYSFTAPPNGAAPYGAVLIANHGQTIYGATFAGGEFGFGTVYTLSKKGETVLYNFTGGADGSEPYAGLVMDASGILYGTTSEGGQYGFGTVFELNPTTGQETVLHSFAGEPDGRRPLSGLLLNEGNLYGTTVDGGTDDFGAIYEVNIQTQAEQVLQSFVGDFGGSPLYGNLLRDASGNLYGTTFGGNGNVWEFSADGVMTILYNFTGGPNDGGEPDQSLAMDNEGNLYGTTEVGGSSNGTVFKVNIASQTETLLHIFAGGNGGGFPSSGLVRDSSGNLFGTTAQSANGDGTVFEISGSKFRILHFFNGLDGSTPIRSPLLLEDGVLFGVTYLGGADGNGTVFALKP